MSLEPASAMLKPPVGWQVGDFWGDLVLDARGHTTSLVLGGIFALLLMAGRALLPPADRKRLRLAVFFFIAFFVSVPVRALLLTWDLEEYYGGAALTGDIMLAWGIIGVGGLLFFDLLGRRARAPKIIRDVTISVASILSLLVLLSRSGVNLLSLITTSAVLTAVIGFALQDTLGNLMSGIALQLESSINIGDWIKLDERGQIGRVREIRWRSTLIETRNGDLVIIPNGMLTKNVITNFAKDGLENRRWVHFHVHYRHPPNQVIATVLEALRGAPNVSERTPPDCIINKFLELGIEYAVRYRLVDFRPDDPTDSEVRKRIWYALRRHGIEIPYPHHNVFVTELNEERQQRKDEQETQRRLEALARVEFFAPLDEGDRALLASGLKHQVFAAGEAIIRAGDPGDSLYLIRSGNVSVRIGLNGLEREVASLGAGQFFGEMGLMTGEPRRATVVAKDDVECYVVDRAVFQQILARKQSLVDDVSRLLNERELALRGEREGLTVEATAQSQAQHQALLGRIKNFFGLA